MCLLSDKTNNIYKDPPQEHNKLLKLIDRLEKAINMETKNITKNLHFSCRTECLTKTKVFIKENFQSSLPGHVINFFKSEVGKRSKTILENINQV